MLSNRQLEIFATVYEAGSMTGAARKLKMSQPAISQTIKEIETMYGAEMFERYGSKLHVTQAGEVLYNYSKRITNLYRDLDEAISVNEGVKEIRIGGNISVGTAQMRPLIEAFNKLYPEISVKVMIFQAPILLRAIKKNEIDIALIEDRKDDPAFSELITEPYYNDRITVIAPKNHKYAGQSVYLEQLADETFLFREKTAGVRAKFDHILSLKGYNVNIGWECISTEAIVDALMHGLGIAVLPYLLVKKNLDNDEVAEITLKDVSLSRTLNITYHKDKVLTKPLQNLIGLVRDMFGEI